MFADAVIPRKQFIPYSTYNQLLLITGPLVTEDSAIPHNVFGVPVFPGIDLNVVTPADTCVLIEEYWAHIWGMWISSIVATRQH